MGTPTAPDAVKRLVETFDRRAATDKAIDALVDELDGLTEREIRIVEEGSPS
jgi:hypothetical protein